MLIRRVEEQKSSKKEVVKKKKDERVSQLEFQGSLEEIGRQIIDHFFEGMRAKDIEKTCMVLHSEVTYMDAVKGFEKVEKHLEKTFEHREKDWLELKKLTIESVSEDKIVIYTLENDEAGLGDNYGYYELEKEHGQFRIKLITIPDEGPEGF